MGSWTLLVGFVPAIAYGAERPDWAFPVTASIGVQARHRMPPLRPWSMIMGHSTEFWWPLFRRALATLSTGAVGRS
jgi:hypothetical protein